MAVALPLGQEGSELLLPDFVTARWCIQHHVFHTMVGQVIYRDAVSGTGVLQLLSSISSALHKTLIYSISPALPAVEQALTTQAFNHEGFSPAQVKPLHRVVPY
jgi:hypothetical protein